MLFKGIIFLAFIINAASATNDTTTVSPLTTVEPLTVPPPKPQPKPTEQDLSFNLTNGDVVCALFSFIGSIHLPATTTPKTNETTIPLTNATTVNKASSCDKDRTSLVLNINGDTAQTLNITLKHADQGTKTYQLNLVTLTLANKTAYLYNGSIFNIDDDKSYLCSSNPQIELVNLNKNETSNATLNLRKLKIDAFRTSKDTDFRYAVECDADFPTNDFVPLVVGCSLIVLVFIVLVAYIVGRRRNRRLTYQSV